MYYDKIRHRHSLFSQGFVINSKSPIILKLWKGAFYNPSFRDDVEFLRIFSWSEYNFQFPTKLFFHSHSQVFLNPSSVRILLNHGNLYAGRSIVGITPLLSWMLASCTLMFIGSSKVSTIIYSFRLFLSYSSLFLCLYQHNASGAYNAILGLSC